MATCTPDLTPVPAALSAALRKLPLHTVTGTDANPKAGWTMGALALLGYAEAAGDAACGTRLLAQVRAGLKGSTCPTGQGGFGLQFEIGWLAGAVAVRRSPALWKALTADEQAKVDVLVRAIGAGAGFVASDLYPWKTSKGVTVFGREMWRNGGANFSAAPPAAVSLVTLYLGGPAAARAYLAGFDKAALHAELKRLGLTQAATVWAPRKAAPTDAEITRVVRGLGTGKLYGGDLDHLGALWAGVVGGRIHGRRIMSGLGGTAANGWIGAGVKHPKTGKPRGRIMTSATPPAWWRAVAGQPGMVDEFEQTDAGGKRSSMSYALLSAWVGMVWTAALLTADELDLKDAGQKAALESMVRGYLDLRLKNEDGFWCFAHGGTGSMNDDWTAANHGKARGLTDLLLPMAAAVLAPLAGVSWPK